MQLKASKIQAMTDSLQEPTVLPKISIEESRSQKTEITQEEPSLHTGATKLGVTLGGIKGIKEAAREKLKSQQKSLVKIELSEEKLKLAWQEIVDIVAKGKALYKSAIEASELFFDGTQITILANVVAFDFLKSERQLLLDFFKEKFQNEEINVLFDLLPEKKESEGVKILSAKEIFEKMADKNPSLRDLRNSLGLDIEY